MHESIALKTDGARLLTADEAAELINVKAVTLSQWRCFGKGPSFLKIEGMVRYDTTVLVDWLNQNWRTSTSDHAANKTAT